MKFFDRFKKSKKTPLQGAPVEDQVVDEEKKEKPEKSDAPKKKDEKPKKKDEKKEKKEKEQAEKKKKEAKEEKKKKEKERDLKDTKGAHRVLIQPIITEKATITGTYVFQVDANANKNEVKKAIHRVYGITPLHVRIINVKGKAVRWNYRSGQQKSWKKAIVRLPKGETINVYEGT